MIPTALSLSKNKNIYVFESDALAYIIYGQYNKDNKAVSRNEKTSIFESGVTI